MKNKYAEQVKQFNDTFCPDAKSTIYGKLIREEFNEWFDEVESGNREKELKELVDLLYVVYGYAHTQKWDIQKNSKEVGDILETIEKAKLKYPDSNLPMVIVATGYIEFITGKDYLWLYRLAQGIFAYAQANKFPIEQAFGRVHKSNMSKLTKDGKVLRREDGKVLKSDQYKPCNLKDLIDGKPLASNKKRA